MSTSVTIFKEDGINGNRRRCPREPLKCVVVLAFFGETNWGKLVDVNESGMCLEFEQRPALGERISFTLETMGRMPASFGGEVINNSFQAAGEIKWTRDFERTAGVQFADLAEESREQIRHWLFFEASTSSVTLSDEAKRETPDRPPELLEPMGSSSEGPCKEDLRGSSSELEKSERNVEPQGTLESQFTILEAPIFEAYSKLPAEEKPIRGPIAVSKEWMARIGLVAVSACLASLGVMAGLKTILPLWARRPDVAARISSPTVNETEPISAKYGSGTRSPSPFLVEVVAAENRRWLLRVSKKTAKAVADRAAYKFPLPSSPALQAKAAGRARQMASARPASGHEFALAPPKVSHPRANGLAENSLPSTAPVVPNSEEPPPQAIRGILAGQAMPVPVIPALPAGSRVHEAHLIKSVPPVYPALAKTNHVTGEVTLDALIDSTGKVTDVKVITGPTLLRQAAMDALRLWKYEPALLDGHPVSTHLAVTVKFYFQ